MSELSNQVMRGDFPTPTMESQLAPPESWYQLPVGIPTTTEINRAREALARLQLDVGGGREFVNVPMAEKAGIGGEAGPGFKAIWLALAKAASVANESHEDSSLTEWQRMGCPV